ncbi:MAG TPA: insulinase family protein, partial [Blastocatellia bacterium]|nr:insulinase family protein [Blastocatellia bacterium]
EKVSGLLTRNLSDGDRLTQTALTLFYGAFPYGHPIEGTADSISRITRDDIVSYHSRFYIANNAAVVIQGDVTAAQVTNVARAKFGVWEKNDVVAATFRPPSPLEGSQIFISDQPSANQAVAVICQGGASRKAHDYLAAELMAAMIPPVASGELSVPGLKIESTLDGRVLPGPLTLQITAPADKLTAAVNSVRSVMARIAAGDVPADQLDRAKQRLIESFSASLNAPEATAVELLDIEEYDLGRDYFLNYVDRVNAVSMADIANSAHKYLTPGSLVIGIDGPASQIEGPMKKVGAVSIVR